VAADKSLKWYEEGWHDLLFEPEYNEVLADVDAWLAARI
jgi:alpha-beta hydrolase superfamily lysophospholipase